MSMYLDVIQFETYVAACARNSGTTVVWDKPDSTPRTTGKMMWLPKLTMKTTDEWLTRMRYFVKHETSHVVHSDFDFLNKKRPTGLLALINNLIEDHRIDYINDQEYAGDVDISNNFWKMYADDVSKRTKSADAELAEQQLTTLPLFVWDALCRDWIESSNEMVAQLTPMLDEEGHTRLDKLVKYTPELLSIRATGGAAEVYDLSVRILEDLFDAEASDYTDKPEAEAEGGSGSGKGKGKGTVGGDDVDRLITVDKLVSSMGHEHKPSRTGIHLKPTKLGAGDYSIPNPRDYVIVEFPKLHPEITSNSTPTSGYLDVRRTEEYITNNAKPMANQLRLKLQTRSRDRYEYGLKRGKIHNGSLHRVLHGDVPSAERLFRQRKVNDTLDTAVCLLVDCSGSMSGSKFDMACAGAGAVGEALKPLNVAYTTLGFTNTLEKEEPIVWVFSDFGERVAQQDLVKRFERASGCLWQNSDGDGIAYATHKLQQRKEPRKVLIVLSDGSPSGRDWAGDVEAYTKRTVEYAEKAGIDVYGIGIKDTNVTRFYKKNVVVNDISNLSKTILDVLDRSFK
jgi:cobalamin biosynthesis protein CobT